VSAHAFVHQYRVTYADVTVGNHVYYARYLDLLEAARGEFFRHLGTSFCRWQDQDFIFPVVEVRLRYKSSARYDDVLNIAVWATAAERIRLNFAYRLVNQHAALILEAETLHVSSGLNEKPRRLPPELAAALQPHLRPPLA
jgi:acyl-CoA thioester hydrolase